MVNLKPEVKLMSVNVDQLTDRDIQEYKDDIAKYQRSQRLFSRLGFIFLGHRMGILGCSTAEMKMSLNQ